MFRIKTTAARLAPLIGLAAIVIGIVLPPAEAYAQATVTRPPLSLTTSPLPLSVVTQPGKTVSADIRVKNNSTTPEKLKIELLKFGANGESGNPQLHERESKDTYFDWVSFSEQTFTAEPNVWKTIKMTIKTPPGSAFGYYLAVLFSRASPDKPTGGASAVEGGVASLVLLDVEAPGAKREAKVVNLTADRKVYEFLPANLNIRLRNSGNVHVSPSGSIIVKHGGKQVGTMDFNTARGNILPSSNRVFESSWNDGFPHYEEKTEGTKKTKVLKWDFGQLQKFRFGHYTATLIAVYDDGQRDVPIEATVGFWVIPWRILGVLLLILLLVGAGVWMVLRSIWRKMRPRPKHPGDPGGTSEAAAEPAPEAPAAATPVDLDPANEPVTAPEPLSVPTRTTEATHAPKAPSAPVFTTRAKKQKKPKQPASAPSLVTGQSGAEGRKTAPELKD
jgi:hypothetical protein